MSIKKFESSSRDGLRGNKATPNINILKRLARLILNEVKDLEDDDELVLGNGFKLDHHVRKFEMNIIRYALQVSNDNQLAASRLLGIKPTTLNTKIKRYQIYSTGPGRKRSDTGLGKNGGEIFRRISRKPKAMSPAPL